MSKQEKQTDPRVETAFNRLCDFGTDETYSTRVVVLFRQKAGDRFLEAAELAGEIMTQEGKKLERALADALERLDWEDKKLKPKKKNENAH